MEIFKKNYPIKVTLWCNLIECMCKKNFTLSVHRKKLISNFRYNNWHSTDPKHFSEKKTEENSVLNPINLANFHKITMKSVKN